ncbi:NAD(P)H-dependent flavin oxidoreductase [Myroides sp. C15-4]|uniref:NAD(P)H-dependent flavin oxidoreductase n=1 Tax=Myroides sp. C15-4 TaxID=3400532 RepID=UPI003D2F95AD
MHTGNFTWDNRITQLLQTKYPIIQAPMFGVATPKMVAAAGEIGVLGTLPLGDLPASKCVELIRATKQLTSHPFAVNVFLNSLPERTAALERQYTRTKQFIEELAQKSNITVNLASYDDVHYTDYRDQVDAIIAEGCKIVSFTFGVFDDSTIAKLKANHIVLIGTCTSVEEAKVLEEKGIDLICVQGIEAGGHQGTFLSETLPKIGGLSLLAQVSDAVHTPLIYAGGLYNAKTILAAKTLGAQGFAIGSLLMGSQESNLAEFEKEALRQAKASDLVLTKSFSGRYARGLNNTFTKQLDHTHYILPYPFQNKLTLELRRVAKQNEDPQFLSLWTGQSQSSYSGASIKAILIQLIHEVETYNPPT